MRQSRVTPMRSTEGNPDTFWDVSLRNDAGAWLIEIYGQGEPSGRRVLPPVAQPLYELGWSSTFVPALVPHRR